MYLLPSSSFFSISSHDAVSHTRHHQRPTAMLRTTRNAWEMGTDGQTRLYGRRLLLLDIRVIRSCASRGKARKDTAMDKHINRRPSEEYEFLARLLFPSC